MLIDYSTLLFHIEIFHFKKISYAIYLFRLAFFVYFDFLFSKLQILSHISKGVRDENLEKQNERLKFESLKDFDLNPID